MANITFTPVSNSYAQYVSTLKDEHDLIQIENKTPKLRNIGKIVRGETHSNILTFEMNRFFDNEDLSTKGIQFILKNNIGILVEPASNIEYTDDIIRFSYVMSHFSTSENKITIAIEFYGVIDDEQDYILKTVPFTIEIEDSLNSNDMNVYMVSNNLYVNLMNRLDVIEDKLNNSGSFSDSDFEDVPINFETLMEVTTNEETN